MCWPPLASIKPNSLSILTFTKTSNELFFLNFPYFCLLNTKTPVWIPTYYIWWLLWNSGHPLLSLLHTPALKSLKDTHSALFSIESCLTLQAKLKPLGENKQNGWLRCLRCLIYSAYLRFPVFCNDSLSLCLQMIESALLNKQEGAGKYLGWGL